MVRGGPGDVAQAKSLLKQTVTEADRIGFHRSLIAALALLARLALERGDGTEAVDWSAGAVSVLRKKKWFTPTVRTEEVLFVHSIALRQAGRAEAADAFLRGAMRVLQRKANSIPDLQGRRAFLERVSLSRRIVAAAETPTATH